MKLTGLHLLLTYRCTLQCDHCFVWGGPAQEGTMGIEQIQAILGQAEELGSIEWIFFEGGEPTLFYPLLLEGLRRAARMGFRTGIVTNAYWATSKRDATVWLGPLAPYLDSLTLSADAFHGEGASPRRATTAQAAAAELELETGVIAIDPDSVMHRGRAAEHLAAKTTGTRPDELTACPHEDLKDPERLHVDCYGNLHLCQGILIGNLFETPLREICRRYDAEAHPIAGPLIKGGPKELAATYALATRPTYADACHLCYESRTKLRARFPDQLGPDQMYGDPEPSSPAPEAEERSPFPGHE